ncbi:MAG: 2-amino-4-hydroxy-6-hydroxymethyldihydropteridine diphosphokinase [Alphaproteobacteria bacterium]|nr:2-amino-4-hydroxy-6-hydroxymethyldihydropteridine diphosphokinase [Alphaproteobacteria bacterium]
MIYMGLGANLPGPHGVAPRDTILMALTEVEVAGVCVTGVSCCYKSKPVPASDQPDYVNAVAALKTGLAPGPLLDLLHEVEARLGRKRLARNGARVIDLDLLDYHGQCNADWPVLPHPRMAGRAFVLRPLLDLAPEWRHPISGKSAVKLLAAAADRADLQLLVSGSDKKPPQGS